MRKLYKKRGCPIGQPLFNWVKTELTNHHFLHEGVVTAVEFHGVNASWQMKVEFFLIQLVAWKIHTASEHNLSYHVNHRNGRILIGYSAHSKCYPVAIAWIRMDSEELTFSKSFHTRDGHRIENKFESIAHAHVRTVYFKTDFRKEVDEEELQKNI